MTSSLSQSPRRAVFSLLRRKARQAYRQGRLGEALAHYEEALAWANLHGTVDDKDRAVCGRASVAIELGSGTDAVLGELRAILMRSGCEENCFLAANNIGRLYELRRLPRKSEFYARIARDRAAALGSREWLASAHNLLGNAFLAESRGDEARFEYCAALELIPATMNTWRALVEQNLGYAFVVSGELQLGFRLLHRSLRTLRRNGAERYTSSVHVDLAFAHLEANRPVSALRHAQRAATAAERDGDRDLLKNALYLLGHAANQLQHSAAARSTFVRLQREFFPGSQNLADFLLAVDVRQLVSLRA